jgi:hypothetical protein
MTALDHAGSLEEYNLVSQEIAWERDLPSQIHQALNNFFCPGLAMKAFLL